MPPCRSKTGKFVSCGKKKKGSRKYTKKRKEKESKSRRKSKESRGKSKESRGMSKKRKVSTPKSRRKYVSRKVPKAPMAPSSPGGMLRPGYYRRVSRPPPAPMAPTYPEGTLRPGYYQEGTRSGYYKKASPPPAGATQGLCWINKDSSSCLRRPGCKWDKMTESCVSRGKASREAALKLGVHGPKLPLTVCGSVSNKQACDSTQGCRWSMYRDVCIPKKAEHYLPEYQVNQPW